MLNLRKLVTTDSEKKNDKHLVWNRVNYIENHTWKRRKDS